MLSNTPPTDHLECALERMEIKPSMVVPRPAVDHLCLAHLLPSLGLPSNQKSPCSERKTPPKRVLAATIRSDVMGEDQLPYGTVSQLSGMAQVLVASLLSAIHRQDMNTNQAALPLFHSLHVRLCYMCMLDLSNANF